MCHIKGYPDFTVMMRCNLNIETSREICRRVHLGGSNNKEYVLIFSFPFIVMGCI